MDDAIIDTNVLIVASLAHSGEFDGSHRTRAECSRVLEWLESFRSGPGAIILDNGMEIWAEYNHKLSARDYGLYALAEIMVSRCRLYEIEYEAAHDNAAVVPVAFAELDRSDRKFLAVALADVEAGHNSAIVNATDTQD